MGLDPHVLAPLPADLRAEVQADIDRHGSAAAIDRLLEHNRLEPSDAVELTIRNLGVVEGIARQNGRPASKFSIDGPHIELPRTEQNLPFVTSDQLSAAAIRAGLRSGGCLLVKGLLEPETVASLCTKIDEAMAEPLNAEAPQTSRFNLVQPIAGRSVGGGARRKYERNEMRMSVDTPHALLATMEAYREAGLLQAVEEHLGARPVLASEKAALRRVNPEGNLLAGWHQDGAFLEQPHVLNAWLSLSHCGVDAPGLEVLTRRVDDVIPSDSESMMNWLVSHKKAHSLANEQGGVEIPHFEPGDCLLFDELFLHRTARLEGMTERRYAIESWFFDPGTVADKYLPVFV